MPEPLVSQLTSWLVWWLSERLTDRGSPHHHHHHHQPIAVSGLHLHLTGGIEAYGTNISMAYRYSLILVVVPGLAEPTLQELFLERGYVKKRIPSPFEHAIS